MESEEYHPEISEPHWQSKWDDAEIFITKVDDKKVKFYCLEMYPYPSGKMHMGHVRNYSIGDAVARYKRALGFNVIYPMVKKLDRYILQSFLSNFLFSIIVFLVVFILVDLIDRLDKFMDAGMPRSDILRYYFLTVPWFISIAIPMSLLISTVFSLGVLQKRNEITAIKASGISIRRFSISLLFVGIIFSLGSFYFDNNVVTQAMHSRTILEDKYFKSNQKPHIRKKHIHRQISPQEILIIHRYLFKQKTARNISIQKFNDGNIISRLDAPEMKWNDKTELWYIPYYTIRQWTKSDSLI